MEPALDNNKSIWLSLSEQSFLFLYNDICLTDLFLPMYLVITVKAY